MKKYRKTYIGISILVLFLFLIPLLVNLYIDYLWFNHLGFATVFITRITTQIGVVLATTLVLFGIIFSNLWVAAKPISKIFTKRKFEFFKVFSTKYQLLLAALIALMAALQFQSAWLPLLKFMNQTPFGMLDPIFARDIGFYVFSLPFYF